MSSSTYYSTVFRKHKIFPTHVCTAYSQDFSHTEGVVTNTVARQFNRKLPSMSAKNGLLMYVQYLTKCQAEVDRLECKGQNT